MDGEMLAIRTWVVRLVALHSGGRGFRFNITGSHTEESNRPRTGHSIRISVYLLPGLPLSSSSSPCPSFLSPPLATTGLPNLTAPPSLTSPILPSNPLHIPSTPFALHLNHSNNLSIPSSSAAAAPWPPCWPPAASTLN